VVISSLTIALGCHRVVSGVDPEPLGYGGPAQESGASGYDTDPVPRAAPMPWTPPDRSGSPTQLGALIGAASAPDPVAYTADIIRVCEHLGSRVAVPNVGTQTDVACRRRQRIAQVFRTIGDWKTLVACLAATTDVMGVDACQLATPASVAPIAAHPRESGVCMHVFALSIVEELGPEPMLDPARLEEFEPLLSDCVNSLVNEERAERGPDGYATMLECVEAALTSTAAELCADQ
jgi:hypothetical protein